MAAVSVKRSINSISNTHLPGAYYPNRPATGWLPMRWSGDRRGPWPGASNSHTGPMHRRTGRGGEGGCSPPKFWATQIFWVARENLGKASFSRRRHVFIIILKRWIFPILTWSRRNNPVTFTRDSGCLAPDEFQHGYKGKVSYADFFYCWALYCNGLFPVVNWLE